MKTIIRSNGQVFEEENLIELGAWTPNFNAVQLNRTIEKVDKNVNGLVSCLEWVGLVVFTGILFAIVFVRLAVLTL